MYASRAGPSRLCVRATASRRSNARIRYPCLPPTGVPRAPFPVMHRAGPPPAGRGCVRTTIDRIERPEERDAQRSFNRLPAARSTRKDATSKSDWIDAAEFKHGCGCFRIQIRASGNRGEARRWCSKSDSLRSTGAQRTARLVVLSRGCGFATSTSSEASSKSDSIFPLAAQECGQRGERSLPRLSAADRPGASRNRSRSCAPPRNRPGASPRPPSACRRQSISSDASSNRSRSRGWPAPAFDAGRRSSRGS